jgi:hypothetical protein
MLFAAVQESGFGAKPIFCCAQSIDFVEFVQVVKLHNDKIENDQKENYAAFVCILAPNHVAAREGRRKDRAALRVKYRR